jgi:alpha-L-rhamnosidase
MPWEQYEQYADTTLFAELYAAQDKLLQYYETLFTTANNYTHNASLGAYSGAEAAGSNAVISQQFYIYFADYMARVGRRIGQNERADHYAALARTLRKSFVGKYWDAGLGHFTQGSISSENTLAIEFGIVPGSDLDPSDPLYIAGGPTRAQNRARLSKLLADRIVDADYHIVNDMYGSRYEFNILDDYGYTDVALQAVTQTGAPGYVDQIAKGATSLWENWTGGSLDHHYRSNVATWFYQGLAGIQPTSTAYETVRIRPHIPSVAVNAEVPTSPTDTNLAKKTLDQVNASIDTVRGTVASSWTRLADGRIGLTVTVPSNTQAEIWVPTQGKPVTAPAGATYLREDTSGGEPYAVYQATIGTYAFNGGAR